MKPNRLFENFIAAFAILFSTASSAQAAFHAWRINEIYSSADGSVQFIELKESLNMTFQNQLFTQNTAITNVSSSGIKTFKFPADLPSTATAGKFFIIGTSNLASIPGGVKPDYVFTNAGPFLSLDGGTIKFAGSTDIVNYTNLPTDGNGGMISANFTFNRNLNAVTTNFPVNFRGATNVIVPVRLASIAQGDNNILVSFPTATGTNGTVGPNYAVEASDAVDSGSWNTLTNLTGNGTLLTVTNEIGTNPVLYFRLRVP